LKLELYLRDGPSKRMFFAGDFDRRSVTRIAGLYADVYLTLLSAAIKHSNKNICTSLEECLEVVDASALD
jgi:hypothetical protein